MPLFIGIAGGTGSGKTTVAHKLVERMPEGQALLISHDWYYRERGGLSPEQRAAVNFDEPDALENVLLAEHLDELRLGRSVRAPQYDFTAHTRRKETVLIEPRPLIVVEGILLFAVRTIRDALDLRIFVDTDDDVRLLRRLRRDMIERGRDLESVERQYTRTVRPMHRLHVEPSKQHADLIIPEGGENERALDVVVSRMLRALR